MSIHDGPGIRSTLFLKGCDLRCAWCHNPETWSKHRQLQYIASKCIRCGTCIAACDQKALRAGERLVIDRAGCNRCGKCTEVCPTGAMSWIGREVSADEAVRELSADKIFFRTSGGGVTLSGGEPLLQTGFAREVLGGLPRAGNPYGRRVEPYGKLGMSSKRFSRGETLDVRPETGRPGTPPPLDGTGQWTDNLQSEATRRQGGADNRTHPVVPGVNDTAEAIDALCRIISGLGGNVAYELLGFHPLGFGKFDDLGMTNPMAGTGALDGSILEELKKIPRRYGIKSKL